MAIDHFLLVNILYEMKNIYRSLLLDDWGCYFRIFRMRNCQGLDVCYYFIRSIWSCYDEVV